MMDDQERLAITERAVVFMNTIGQSAIEQQLPRGLIIRLFGKFAQRLVETDVKEGEAHEVATQRAIDNFLRGFGFEREPDEPPTPLQ